MAKFFGKIGYAVSKDVRPGVWDGEITEREYFGDLIRNTSRYQTCGMFQKPSWPLLKCSRISNMLP